MIYLDYNATTPLKPAVRTLMLETMERIGNPSSIHRYGRVARREVEEARAALAALIGVKPTQITFTSGGTEANMTICRGLNVKAFATSAIEHDSILAATPAAERLPVTLTGMVDLVAAEAMISTLPVPSLISVMLVNNETGVIQPVTEIAAMAKKYGHYMHTDAVQVLGRLPIDFEALGVDALTVSAHKIGGPMGVGALVVREGLFVNPLILGGGQERGLRSGTENVAGIVGFGAAARLAADDLRDMPRLIGLRDNLQERLLDIAGDHATVIGLGAPRVANTLLIAMRDIGSETQVMAMDLSGVAVSSGSACSSGKTKASHVLRAMGYGDDIAGCSLRISMGWNTQDRDIERCVEAWEGLYERTHRQIRKSQAA